MKQILSLQSHVAFGHVGNCAATYPLQRLGHEVSQMPTVLYSNHKGYGKFGGDTVPIKLLRDMRDSLLDQGRFKSLDAILSGYLGNEELAGFVAETVAMARQENPDLVYICDPVMGDTGKGMYVPETLLPVYQQTLAPLSDILFPNLFELETLTGRIIDSPEDCIAAARSLNANQVVVTSLPWYGENRIGMMAVDANSCHAVDTESVALNFIPGGSGDTTAALFTGYRLQGQDTAHALDNTARSIHHIFRQTAKTGGTELDLITACNNLPDPV